METCVSDLAFAKHISKLLNSNVRISDKDIRVTVDSGWVFLEGQVGYENERSLIQSCVENVFGVDRVVNNLTFPRANTR